MAIILTAGIFVNGCYAPSGRVDPVGSTLAGGAIGAGTGALIGSASHHGGEGALIGGVIGLITGSLVGESMAESQRAQLRREAPRTYERVEQGQPLAVADIKALSKAGISDDVIISQIRNAHVVYRLTTAEILDLKDAGVSNKVIDYMINTPGTNAGATPVYHEVVVSEAPPEPIAERVYVGPGPDYVWIGGSWGWYGGRWVWYSGHWARPPYRTSVWIAPHCERRSGTTVWISGYWH